ncbi:MAG: hypothetical protein AAF599_08160 [Bacteroidota bacterium]
MLKQICFTFIFLFLTQITTAQELGINGTPVNSRWGFSVGYYGYQFNNFGLQLGAENYLAATKNFQVLSISSIQFYTSKETQNGIELNLRFGQRYTTDFGLLLENYIGIGTAYTTFFSPTIDFTTGQSFTTKTNNWGIKPNLTLGMGYDFKRKSEIAITTYLRTNISWLYPDRNLVFQNSMFLEAGIVFTPTLGRKK